MNYTIIYTEDLATGQKLSIEKSGNLYNVSFCENDKYVGRLVKTIDEAQRLYTTIANYFIHSVYKFEDRAEILKRGE